MNRRMRNRTYGGVGGGRGYRLPTRFHRGFPGAGALISFSAPSGRFRFVGGARLAAPLSAPAPWLGSQHPSPSPRRPTSFLAKGGAAARLSVLWLAPRRTRASGRGSSTRLLPRRRRPAIRAGPLMGLFRPHALDSRPRGEGDGCWHRTVRIRGAGCVARGGLCLRSHVTRAVTRGD